MVAFHLRSVTPITKWYASGMLDNLATEVGRDQALYGALRLSLPAPEFVTLSACHFEIRSSRSRVPCCHTQSRIPFVCLRHALAAIQQV